MIDLHIHTTNSDGDLDEISILKIAEEKKLKVISITDHESIDAYKKLETTNLSRYYKGILVNGIEIAFSFNGISMDMLGYNIDINTIETSRILQNNKNINYIEKESTKLNHLLQVCNQIGILHSLNLKIKSKNNTANDIICDDILTYKDNINILNSLGITDRTTFYRKHCLNPSSPFFIHPIEHLPSIHEAAYTIHTSGGKCFLAHPYVYDVDDIENYISNIVNLGLIDGIECIHRKHSNEQINMLIDYCNRKSLLKSGGSDFHTSSHSLGFGNDGRTQINYDIAMNWLHQQ